MVAALLSLLAATPAVLVLATVTVDNPLDGQLPLIARVGVNYTWSISPLTFSTDLGQSLSYTASGLPSWCWFDNTTQTFQGVPSAKDEGSPQVTISASDSKSSAASSFFLPVTADPPPILQIPLQTQFFAGSPSLDSVFFLSPDSALKTDNFAFRIPSRWSFSISILSDTFLAPNDIYYAALQADGTPLPDWVTFDTDSVTFDGVSPSETDLPTPYTLSIDVHASDQPGYSAETVSFDLVVASRELYALSTLPTVNVTADSPFNFTVTAAADFTGILVDGEPLQPENITDLSIDVSSYQNWLQYDAESRTLFGIPPAGLSETDATHGGPVLPAKLTTDFNQTLEMTMSLAVVSSYFSASDLGVVDADPGQEIQFDLTQFFSNKTDIAQNHNDANLSVTFYPDDANSYLSFDPASARLDGQVPGDSQLAKIVVTFIAYSQVTHSTSHATLSVVSPQLEARKQGLETSARITAIVFGIIGGLMCLGVAVALYRRHTRVRSSTVLAEEGALARSDEEKKKYHGIATNCSKALREDSKNDNWSRKANTSISVEKCSLRKPPGTNENLPPNEHEDLGLGLPRAVKQMSSTTHADTHSVRSGEFLGRVKETVRIVSKKYKRKVTPARPIIGAPKPLTPRHGMDELPIGHYVDITTIPSQYTLDNPFSDTEINVKRASTVASLVGSPSDSTDEKSIPRRRADFGPPRSLRSPRVLAPAAVKDTARRSILRESIQSASTISYEPHPETVRIVQPAVDKSRVKQFAYSSRVPPPRSMSNNQATLDVPRGTRRTTSHTANVYQGRDAHRATGSIDELSIGMHYVRTLGESSSNIRSMSDESLASLTSFQPGRVTAKENRVSRFIVRTGERFKFRVPMKTGVSTACPKLEARQILGQALPQFLQLELKGHTDEVRKVVEFSGIPTAHDVGEIHVGVFNADGGECLAKVIVEIVENRSSPLR